MITVNKINHITQVVPEVDPQVQLLQGLFGFQLQSRWDDGAVAGALLDIPGRSDIRWQVLSPKDSASQYQEFIDSPRGPGVHHVAVEVDDVAATAAELSRAGVEPAATGDGWVEARMNPANAEGLRYRFHVKDALPGGAVASAAAPDAPRLDIVGVDHICQAYANRDELARWYEGLLGYREIWRTADGEHDDLADLVMETPGKQMFWEIIQPEGVGSFIERFVNTRGPAAHHVTFEVRDWAKAMAACETHEIPTFDDNSGVTDGATWNDTFVHPKHTGGMLVQLFWEEKPGVWVRSDKIPSNG